MIIIIKNEKPPIDEEVELLNSDYP
nr:hypothetical protein [Tanacetum cinerariifolium]